MNININIIGMYYLWTIRMWEIINNIETEIIIIRHCFYRTKNEQDSFESIDIDI